MLNISGIHEGFVLDHIKAGMSLSIYHNLKLDKLDCTVAIIKNAKSNKMGKKDIIKVECPIDALDLDILGFIDHNITVNIIKGDKIVEKKDLSLQILRRNVYRLRFSRISKIVKKCTGTNSCALFMKLYNCFSFPQKKLTVLSFYLDNCPQIFSTS